MPEASTEEGTLPGRRGRLAGVDDQPADARGGGSDRLGGRPHAPTEGSAYPSGRPGPARVPRSRCVRRPIRGLISGKEGASGERQRTTQRPQPDVMRMSDIKSDVTEEEIDETPCEGRQGIHLPQAFRLPVSHCVLARGRLLLFSAYTRPCSGPYPAQIQRSDPPVVCLRARLPPLPLPHQDRRQPIARCIDYLFAGLHACHRNVSDHQLYPPDGDRRRLYESRHGRRHLRDPPHAGSGAARRRHCPLS